MTPIGTWLCRKSRGETPASVMRRHPPACVYEPQPLDELHRECIGDELDALIGVCTRTDWIAAPMPKARGTN